VFAEQFHNLFDPLANPFANFDFKWTEAEAILERQFVGPGWLIAAVGASILAARDLRAFVFFAFLVATDVVYSMNFGDGDIARYYMLAALVGAVCIGVAVSALAAQAGRAVAEASRRSFGCGGRRRAAVAAGVLVLALAGLLPGSSLLSLYPERAEQGSNRDADRWVASVQEALPPDAVVISWWSYSTPLWYHRWVLAERPDVKIIDERNILDDGYGTIDGAITAFLGRRPVYVVPPYWNLEELAVTWETEPIPTYAGYTDLLRIVARR